MISRNLQEYHRSITQELQVVKDRIRNLIGDVHWQTDGEHKEAVLRKVLRTHLPESMRVSKGFVCYPDGTSTQLDILITARDKPTLFKDGDLILVTPDAVKAIIEVKTNLGSQTIRGALDTLASEVEKIRLHQQQCKAGLFIFEDSRIGDEDILATVQKVSRGQETRVVNWIAVGPSRFVRFWPDGSRANSQINGPVWHSYELVELAYAYFVGNVVWGVSSDNSLEMQFAWFPIRGGKECYRTYYISLCSNKPRVFEERRGGNW